jgi:predicted anti-sigma-YlaC factor YlaD
MNCTHCEEQLSDYMEDALSTEERNAVQLHLAECSACRELMKGIAAVMSLARTFPTHEAPPWLSTRILASTPRIARETWLDTLRAVARWAAQPRIAMVFFSSTLVLSWMGSLAGISPTQVIRVARDPAVLYYEAGTLANRAYTSAIRSYNRAPLVTEIRAQIEVLREIS